jgi:hypothetical protein
MKNARGQAMVELAVALPLIIVLLLGVVEVSFALLNQHIVSKLTREGSNLISRDTSLGDAATALRHMSSRPVNFNNGDSKVIFSVVKRVATTGANNYDRDILYQRYQYGSYAATSVLRTRGAGSFGGAPEYTANNSDNDTSLQILNLPPGMTTLGGMLYVTEVFSRRTTLTPLENFGITLPNTLYSIAYF